VPADATPTGTREEVTYGYPLSNKILMKSQVGLTAKPFGSDFVHCGAILSYAKLKGGEYGCKG